MKLSKLISKILLSLTIFITSGATAQENHAQPVLVASTTQIADFTRQIVGDRCIVRCILAPGADPHTYQPTPEDVKIVLQADLCLENGLHLEGKNWMGTLASDAGKPILTCTQGIAPIEIKSEGQSLPDPHAWFSIRNVAVYVNNITRGVIKLDPAGKADYEARAALYLNQLRILDAWVREQVNRIPTHQRILVTSHDAFNYFCREYRFNANNDYLSLAPVGWSTGSEVGAGMTPERRKKVVAGLKATGAQAVFVETSVNPKLIREIANEAGVRIGGELYSDSMGEKDTAGESYIGMIRENVLLIVDALTRKDG